MKIDIESEKALTKRQIQIVEISFQIINEQGPAALTIRNVAEKIKLSEGAIYRHFKSKEEILLVMMRFFGEQKNKELDQIFSREDLTAIQCLEMMFQNFQQSKKNKSRLESVTSFHQMFSEVPDMHLRIFKMMEPVRKNLFKLIKRGQKNNEINNELHADSLTVMLIGLFKGMEHFMDIADKSHEDIGGSKELAENMMRNMEIMLKL